MQSLVDYCSSSESDSPPSPSAAPAPVLAKRPRVEFEVGPSGDVRVDLRRSLPTAVTARRGRGRFAAHALFARRALPPPSAQLEANEGGAASVDGEHGDSLDETADDAGGEVAERASTNDAAAASAVEATATAAEEGHSGDEAAAGVAPAAPSPEAAAFLQQQQAYWQAMLQIQHAWQQAYAQHVALPVDGSPAVFSGRPDLPPPPPPPSVAAAAAAGGGGIVPPPPLPAPGRGGDKALRRELEAWGARAGRLVGESAHLSVAPTAAGFGAYVPPAAAAAEAVGAAPGAGGGIAGYHGYAAAVAAAAAEEEAAAASGGMVSISGAALRGSWAPPAPDEMLANAGGKKMAVPTKVWNAAAGAAVVSRAEPSRLAKRKHQIGSLAAQAIASGANNLTHRSAEQLSKAQTRSE